MSYEVFSSDVVKSRVVKISSTGLLSSLSFSGTANIRVLVHEDFGFNQSALIQVEVGIPSAG